MRIYDQLPESGQRPFDGKLRDLVTGTYGARPFVYEISIATHLMRKGWDVEFADLCGSAQFDFRPDAEMSRSKSSAKPALATPGARFIDKKSID